MKRWIEIGCRGFCCLKGKYIIRRLWEFLVGFEYVTDKLEICFLWGVLAVDKVVLGWRRNKILGEGLGVFGFEIINKMSCVRLVSIFREFRYLGWKGEDVGVIIEVILEYIEWLRVIREMGEVERCWGGYFVWVCDLVGDS